jgi:hypothetical protein
MWVPGSIAYSVTVMLGFYRWLEADASGEKPRTALTT